MDLTRRACLLLGGNACLALGLSGLGSLLFPEPAVVPALRLPRSTFCDWTNHCLARLSYGVTPQLRAQVQAIGIDAWLEAQLADPTPEPDVTRRLRGYEMVDCEPSSCYEYRPEVIRAQLGAARCVRAYASEHQLYEIMVEFWSDHFAIDMGKADCAYLIADDERRVARAHAFGSFGELVRASLSSPAMLWYLDGRDNRAGPGVTSPPNENHARELLELHTLGVHGGYTQDDILQVARCLSGWTVRARHEFHLGSVVFEPEHHDPAAKTVLGTTIPAGLGAGDRDALCAILVAHPATATHLSTKLCQRFISEQPPAAAVSAVAATFQSTRGDIRACLRTLIATPAFRGASPGAGVGAGTDAAAAAGVALRGTLFKRPFHYLISAMRSADATLSDPAVLLDHLQILGQSPYRCATPAGYPLAQRHWQDGLWWRWRVAADLVGNRLAGIGVDAAALQQRCAGSAGLASHILGRTPAPAETQALTGLDPDQALSVLLASPSFQRC